MAISFGSIPMKCRYKQAFKESAQSIATFTQLQTVDALSLLLLKSKVKQGCIWLAFEWKIQ